ncbi:MAG TPA: hypothetical protein VGO16_00725 [Pseudonocardiaceae bacterium]|nr:hypothetical protein [Pseudonocardiaceae bacterium]
MAGPVCTFGATVYVTVYVVVDTDSSGKPEILSLLGDTLSDHSGA